MEREWYSLRMDVPHQELSYVHNWLVKNERSTKHILGLEEECKNSKNKEHLQCMIYISKTTAQDIRKNLCRQKYKLKGKATKGSPAQYSVAPARDWRVLGCYVQKDAHPDNLYYNISTDELKEMLGRYKTPEQIIQDCIDKSLFNYSSYQASFDEFDVIHSCQAPPKAVWIYSDILHMLKTQQIEYFKMDLTGLAFKNLMIRLFFKNDLISCNDMAYDHLSRFYRR